MGGQVGLQPRVLRGPRRPVGRVVVAVDGAAAGVAVRPVGAQHVEAGLADVERVPLARVRGRVGAVHTAVGLTHRPAARRRHGLVLGPVDLLGAARRGPGAGAVVPRCHEEREGVADPGPERRAEDDAGVLGVVLEVAVVGLAARRVAVVAHAHREVGARRGQLSQQAGGVGVVTGRVGLAPVAEHGERVGGRRARGHLRGERGRRVAAEQVDRGERHPVAVPTRRGERQPGGPLVLRDRGDRDAGAHRGDLRGRRAGAPAADGTPGGAARA